MPSPSAIAANLASLLYLARHRPAADLDLQEGVRVLLAALDGQPLELEASLKWLTINGVRMAPGYPGVRELGEQLLVHDVAGLSLPANAPPEALLRLVRTLSAFAGAYGSWEELLASLGPDQAGATLQRTTTDLTFVHLDGPAQLAGTDEYLTLEIRRTGDPLVDEALGQSLGPSEPHGAPPVDRTARPSAPMEDPAVLRGLLERHRKLRDGGSYLPLLELVGDFLEAADQAVTEPASRTYMVELRRILTRKHFAQFARMAALGNNRELATKVLRRLGAGATEVLMELLVETGGMTERRGYYTALTQMEDGVEVIIHHLQHPTWYVVRNAAELCGEMELKQAVPELSRQTSHPDERVRKSVASALTRIAGSECLEPLRRMLKDDSPAIRLQVLSSLGPSWSRPLAMPLATLLESEEHPEVLREILKALARIGTPDALLALGRVAQGEVGRLGRRDRLVAVEALGECGERAAALLRGLERNPDPAIRAAAAQALAGAPA